MDETDPFDELRQGLRRDDPERPSRLGTRPLAVAGVLVLLLALAVFLTSALRPTPPDAAEPDAVLADLEPVTTASTAVSTTAAAYERVWPAEPVEIVGTEVRTGGHRWSVGDPGDLVAVGDWDCDGAPTPAVVRPSQSRLYVFDAWATPDATAEASPGPTVPDGVTEVAADGCGRATLRTADGRTHLVVIDGAP